MLASAVCLLAILAAMPVKEIVGKTIGFGVVTVSLLAAAVLAFVGPHPYNDTLMGLVDANLALAVILALMGLGTGGLGTLIIGGIIYDARLRAKEHVVHVTPRDGPPDVPPAWGMGDIGRPGAIGGAPHGGGGTRVMSVSVANWDTPLVIGVLIAWTAIALVFLAPR
jgi:hypothetical protein